MTTTAAEYLIRNCTIGFKCEARWESLHDDGINGVRFCGACQKEVHLCKSSDDLMTAVIYEQCVAIEIPKREMFIGLVRPITD